MYIQVKNGPRANPDSDPNGQWQIWRDGKWTNTGNNLEDAIKKAENSAKKFGLEKKTDLVWADYDSDEWLTQIDLGEPDPDDEEPLQKPPVQELTIGGEKFEPWKQEPTNLPREAPLVGVRVVLYYSYPDPPKTIGGVVYQRLGSQMVVKCDDGCLRFMFYKGSQTMSWEYEQAVKSC